jgi:hypothetical protein
MSEWVKKKKPMFSRPERGPIPMARTLVDLNSDVDVLQRRIGERGESAATVGELGSVGLVSQATDGSIVATKTIIDGPQNLYNFLKDFK